MDTIINDFEQVRKIVIDTVTYVKYNDVSAFYSDLADKQATQFTILISVLCGIVVVLIGATWWWNFRGAKKQISEEIEIQKNTMKRWLNLKMKKMEESQIGFNQEFQQSKILLQKSINNQIDRKSKNTEENLTKYIQTYKDEQKKELDDFQNEIKLKVMVEQAELSRIFALHCFSTKSYLTAFTWFLDAAKLYKETDYEQMFGTCIKASIETIKKVEPSDLSGQEWNTDEIIKEVQEIVPLVMSEEKKELLQYIKELKKK